MPAIGAAYISVRPDLTGFHKAVSKELKSFVADFKGLGIEAGQTFASGFKEGLKGADPFEPLSKPPADAPKSGAKAGGAFADAFKRRVEAALRSLPDIEVGADATDAEKKIAELRGQLQELADKKIGVDVSGDEAIAKLNAIRAEYEAIDKSTLTVDARANVTQAIAALDAFKADVDKLNGVTAEPAVDVKLDPAGQARLARVRANLDQIAARVAQARVSANTAEAQAKVSSLEAQLLALDKQTARPDVDLQGVAQAEAQIFALNGSLGALSGQHVTINADFDGAAALGGVKALGIALAALTAIPFGQVVAGGLGAIAASASVAGAGVIGMVAASVPGIKRISDVLQAQKTAQDQVTKATKRQASTAASAEVQQLQAQQRAMAMAQARRQLEQAVANAARQHAQAVQQVRQAEQSLSQAQQSAKQAQEALSAARRQARVDLQDLANSVIDAGLAVRSSQLGVQQAQLDLTEQTAKTAQAQKAIADARKQLADAQAAAAKVNGDAGATDVAKQTAAQQVKDAKAALKAARQAAKEQELAQKRAQLAYQQAIQSLKEQRLQLARLRKEKTAADKAGIDGDKQVVAARRQVQAANQAVRRQEQQLAQARRNVARVDTQSAQQIKAAQQQIAQQRLAARLAAAQQADAARKSAAATDGASAATVKYGRALAELTGPERNLLKHFTTFKKRYDEWAASLEKPVLGAWADWLDTAGKHLDLLSPVTRGAAKAMSGLAKDADKALGGPFWKRFSKDAGTAVGPTLRNLGRAAGNVAKGLAGIIDAFLPYLPGFTKGVNGLAKKFANWGTHLGKSGGFKDFIDDIKKNGPTIKAIFKDLGTIFGKIGKALKDMGPGTLQGLKTVLDAVAKLPPDAIQALVVVGGSAAVGGKGGAGAALGLTGSSVQAYRAGQNPGKGLPAVKRMLLPVGAGAATGAAIGGKLAGPIGGLAGGAIGGAIAETAEFIGLVKTQLPRLIKLWTKGWDFIISRPKVLWRTFKSWLSKTFLPGLTLGFRTAGVKIRDGWRTGWNYVTSRPKVIWANLSGWFTKKFVPGLKGKFTTAKNWVIRLWREGFNYVTSRPRVIWANLSGWFIKKFVPGVKSRFNSAKTWVERHWREGMAYVQTRPKQTWANLSSWFTKKFIPGLANAFRRAVHAIGVAWDKVAGVAKKPINFVIRTVYDRGIKGTWDKVADWLHLGKKYHAPYIRPLADGGVLGGAENHTAHIAPAGAMRLFAEPETGGEAYIPMSPRKRGRSTAILGQVASEFGYGLTSFADGGIVHKFADGGIWNWVKGTFSSIASKVTNFGKSALSFRTHPVDFIKGKVTGAIGKIPGADSPYGAAGKAVSVKMLDQVTAFAKRVADLFGTGGAAMKALKLAESRAGIKYVYGGTNWNSGMDCSGLTMLSYRKAGIGIPRTSQAQWGAVKHISLKAAQPGDLVFTEFGGAGPGHVGFRTQYPYNSPKATFNEPHTGSWAQYRSIGGWTRAGVVPGAHAATFRGTPGSTKGGRHAGPGKSRAWAQAELPELGWRGQFGALNNIWNHESGWRWYAANPSGAYGIPQSLPASKMASAGRDWHDNSYTQMKWGLGYIRSRYGSPNNAWRFWRGHNYYDNGGTLPPGISQVVNASRKPEAVLSNSQWQAIYAAARGGDSPAVVEQHLHFDGLTRGAIESHVRAGVHAAEVAKGRQLQVNRRR